MSNIDNTIIIFTIDMCLQWYNIQYSMLHMSNIFYLQTDTYSENAEGIL